MLDPGADIRRLIAGLVLAVLAVAAFAGSVHAGRHAVAAAHGPCAHMSIPQSPTAHMPVDHATLDDDGGAPRDAADCLVCCHGSATYLTPHPAPGIVAPRLAETLPRLAQIAPTTTLPSGPRRPPRLL